jgi:3-methyladenine DNA glycosylase AlkD
VDLAAAQRVDDWLHHLRGWSEIDILCNNVVTAQMMLDAWPEWL